MDYQWKYHEKCLDSPAIINLHGFTKTLDAIPAEYMVMMDYASKENLRKNLQTISKNNWNKKLCMLFRIISGLYEIYQ
ncbi:hypothetical protein RhiirA1_480676 [Rhizophagus irregularis]|uniref:Uncharacterized protein n=1 Tax=Rhizophagus irregularis TaxID=588596 RepID=A0A2I1F2A8_9GLOM|nr:hypothetical protein RhiirA1_480676 [Rhizophagus irregularis]PKY28507.1 hypothetical protein RhiirB3_444704 [Rhizophagus irregularis]